MPKKVKEILDDDLVAKIDDPKAFKALKSNMKKRKQLDDARQITYTTIHNMAKKNKICKVGNNIEDITWVGRCWEKLRDYIVENYTEPSTARTYLENVAYVLLAIDKVKYRDDTRALWNQGKRLQLRVKKKQGQSLLTEKEVRNFICYEDMVKVQKKMYEAWKANPKKQKLNIHHLLVALVTLVPPMRKNYHEIEFYIKEKEPPKNDKNYMWKKSMKSDQWYFVLNRDKVENSQSAKGFPRTIIDIANDEIKGVTRGKELNKIICESFKVLPRRYVLTGLNKGHEEEHMSESSYNTALKTIFKPKEPNETLFRKAYVNYWWRQNISGNQREEIAVRMRHSTAVAAAAYYKINYPCEDGGNDDIEGPRPIPKPVPRPEPKRDYFDLKAYSKKYREAKKDTIKTKRKEAYEKDKHNILRKKIIWNLNVSQAVKRPRQSTIDKYNLKYNDQTSRWE